MNTMLHKKIQFILLSELKMILCKVIIGLQEMFNSVEFILSFLNTVTCNLMSNPNDRSPEKELRV